MSIEEKLKKYFYDNFDYYQEKLKNTSCEEEKKLFTTILKSLTKVIENYEK